MLLGHHGLSGGKKEGLILMKVNYLNKKNLDILNHGERLLKKLFGNIAIIITLEDPIDALQFNLQEQKVS